MQSRTIGFIRAHLLSLSLACIGVALLAAVVVTRFDHPAATIVLAKGDGLDGPDIQTLERMNGAYERIAQAVLPSIVAIQTTQVVHMQQSSPFFSDPFFRQFFGNMFPNMPQTHREHALGSGTIVSPDGYILTNDHVVRGASDIEVVLHDKRQFKAKVIGADRDSDLAVIKIDAENLHPAILGESSQLHVGDQVIAFGNPYEQYFTMTNGIVSALGRTSTAAEPVPENFIQTDAAINPGNSGGALVNIHGQVVGVPTWIISGGGGPGGQGAFLGIGFAIPIDTAKHVMTDLIKNGKVTRGYLGAEVSSLSPALASEFKVPDTNGALVQNVTPGGPAAKAGLKAGDVIRSVNGQKVTSSDELTIRVMNLNPGGTATLGILRDGSAQNIHVTLGTRPENLSAFGNGNQGQQQGGGGSGQATSGPLAGVGVQDLTPDIRRQLQVPADVNGVVVNGVDPNSPAAGTLAQGDVIESIDRQAVNNVGEFNRLASEAKTRALLRVFHRGASLFVVISSSGQ